jgi:hypothetical protein
MLAICCMPGSLLRLDPAPNRVCLSHQMVRLLLVRSLPNMGRRNPMLASQRKPRLRVKRRVTL